MDWEDCVVDVHSTKLSRTTIETIFKRCGPVRSITHWKGQGEKPHVFFEYKTPSSADSARAVGLDRNDLQVIKISNNEMLKRKFREIAHGPLRERDQRCRPTSSNPRSTYAHFNRDLGNKASEKDHRLPEKPTESTAYVSERNGWGRHRTGARDVQPTRRSSTTASIASSSSNSRERYSRRDNAIGGDSEHTRALITSSDVPLTPPVEVSATHETRLQSHHKSPAILHIHHAGEIIKFDLDTQLEDNPTGIIRILSAVKADQKLWMMTAAYYKGKQNLGSAKKVLEAGIDMAVQVGEESDTKPFWHLLGQVNNIIQSQSSPMTSAFTLSPVASSFSSALNSSPQIETTNRTLIQSSSRQPGSPRPSITKDIPSIPALPRGSVDATTPARVSSSSLSNDPLSHATFMPKESSAPPCTTESTLPSQSRPIGSCQRELPPPPPSPTPPSGPMGTFARLHNLQSEIGALRERQSAVLEDLSFARAAKRRAEDEVKEERSVRRKLEKHLRLAEDALARSKRMEDAALDQVKREVEARRRAEALVADLKARKERVEPPVGGAGPSMFTSSSDDTAILLQLASLIRGIQSNDRTITLPYGSGGHMSSRHSGDVNVAGQSET